MLLSAPGLPSTPAPVDEATPHTASATPSVDISPDEVLEVLITTQQVAFGTAAAAGVRRENIGHRFVAVMRRLFATSTDASRPRPQHVPKRYAFLEDSLMAREMDRL
jgi:hypothetical protein